MWPPVAAVAQMVEHVIRNDGVGGSSPFSGTSLLSQAIDWVVFSKLAGILDHLIVDLLNGGVHEHFAAVTSRQFGLAEQRDSAVHHFPKRFMQPSRS